MPDNRRIEDGRKLLESIDEYLAVGDEWSIHLWAILSGLRGPDEVKEGESEYDIKCRTTNHVRLMAFPRTGEQIGRGFVTIGAAFVTSGDPAAIGDLYDIASHHFVSHYQKALRALKFFGLKNE